MIHYSIEECGCGVCRMALEKWKQCKRCEATIPADSASCDVCDYGKPSEQDYPELDEPEGEITVCPACERLPWVDPNGVLFCECGWRSDTGEVTA